MTFLVQVVNFSIGMETVRVLVLVHYSKHLFKMRTFVISLVLQENSYTIMVHVIQLVTQDIQVLLSKMSNSVN